MEALKKTLESYNSISEEAWHAFCALFTRTKLGEGNHYIHAGDWVKRIAFVSRGVLRCYVLDDEGKTYNKTFFIENDFATAFTALLQQQPSHLYVQALEDCELLEANFTDIVKLFDEHHCLERFYRKFLEQRWVIRKELHLVQFATKDAHHRYHAFRQMYPGLEQRVAQYHIASYLGITPIHLSRIRAQAISS